MKLDENSEESVESLLTITQISERQRRAPALQLDLEELPFVYVLHLLPFSMEFSVCLFLNFSFKLSLVKILILLLSRNNGLGRAQCSLDFGFFLFQEKSHRVCF